MAGRRTDIGFLLRHEAQSGRSQCRHEIRCLINRRPVTQRSRGENKNNYYKYRASIGLRGWSENGNRDKEGASRERILPRLWQSKFEREENIIVATLTAEKDTNDVTNTGLNPNSEADVDFGVYYTSRKPRRGYVQRINPPREGTGCYICGSNHLMRHCPDKKCVICGAQRHSITNAPTSMVERRKGYSRSKINHTSPNTVANKAMINNIQLIMLVDYGTGLSVLDFGTIRELGLESHIYRHV